MLEQITRQHQKKQEFKRLFVVPSKTYAELLQICRSLTTIERAIFNHIALMSNKCRYVYPSQRYLARQAHCTREYVNKVIKKLEDIGLLGTIYRHRTSCYYKISAIFTNPKVRDMFSAFFSAFKFIPFWYLTLSAIYSQPFDSSQFTPRDLTYMSSLNNKRVSKKRGTQKPSRRVSKLQKERNVMDAQYNFPEYTTKIADYLGFSPWARVKMLPFHETVLRRACKMTKDRDPEDKFGYFMKLCNEYSKQQGFTVDRTQEAIAAGRLSMPSDAPMLKKDMPREPRAPSIPFKKQEEAAPAKVTPLAKAWANPNPRELNDEQEAIKFFDHFRKLDRVEAILKWRNMVQFGAHTRYGELPHDLQFLQEYSLVT